MAKNDWIAGLSPAQIETLLADAWTNGFLAGQARPDASVKIEREKWRELVLLTKEKKGL